MKEKILVFTKNWFGDVIMQTPCFRILKENFPDSKLCVVIPERTRWMVENNPCVDEVLPFHEREEGRKLSAKIRFVTRLRREKFTRAYLLHRSKTRAFFSFLAGIPRRIGYNVKGRGFLLTSPVREPKDPMHQTDYFVHLLRRSGLKVPDQYFTEFYFPDRDVQRIEELWPAIAPAGTKRVIVLNPGANWAPKRWPVAYFARTADLLAQDDRTVFVITGSERDIPLAQEMLKQIRKARTVSLCGKTSLGELGALLARSDLMITADSGPMHIASSVGTRVTALFGPTESGKTGPRGKGPVLILEERMNGKADPQELMRAITPEKVAAAIKELEWA